MSKNINPSYMYKFPSGQSVHPSRLIQRDGCLMWKHALLYNGELSIPQTEAHEQHIIKTAQRLEELNSWVSRDSAPWECLKVVAWYVPQIEELSEGIACYFKYDQFDNEEIYTTLSAHILSHETLVIKDRHLYFRRC